MNQFANLHTLVSSDRLCNLIKYSEMSQSLGAYFFEIGIYQGGSLEVLAKYNPTNEIIGIDSFQGLPKESECDFHREGDFGDVDYHSIAGYFKMLYKNVRIVKGFAPGVFSFFDENVRFSFGHIDVDLYQSVKDCLDFFLPRMVTNGIIILDDYKVKSTPGCELAVVDFFRDHPEIEIQYRGELKYWDSETAKSHHQYIIVK